MAAVTGLPLASTTNANSGAINRSRVSARKVFPDMFPAKAVKLEIALQEFTAIVLFPGIYKAIHQAFELIQIRFGYTRTSPLQSQGFQLDTEGIQRFFELRPRQKCGDETAPCSLRAEQIPRA